MKNEIQTSTHDSLVYVDKSKPFTTSLVIAEGVGLEHQFVIRLVRKYKTDFEEFGPLDFQSQPFKTAGGIQRREIAELNEDQATYLITLFKNTDIVRKFKIHLVKEFRRAIKEIARLKNQTSDPAWKLVRDETKLSFRWMTDNLKDTRAESGKETTSIHYMNEAKLINSIIADRYAGMDRNQLSQSDLSFIAELQRINARLIAQGFSYQLRKEKLIYLASGHTALLNGGAQS